MVIIPIYGEAHTGTIGAGTIGDTTILIGTADIMGGVITALTDIDIVITGILIETIGTTDTLIITIGITETDITAEEMLLTIPVEEAAIVGWVQLPLLV
ncbi:hypothetical protein GCM10022395_21800 [Snuella lapsa]|uniref:Uncharacterized protein n=1 Tax=Snuella lapsa TaxID=870481 RepID=A0ABP6XYL6_9FLAO